MNCSAVVRRFDRLERHQAEICFDISKFFARGMHCPITRGRRARRTLDGRQCPLDPPGPRDGSEYLPQIIGRMVTRDLKRGDSLDASMVEGLAK